MRDYARFCNHDLSRTEVGLISSERSGEGEHNPVASSRVKQEKTRYVHHDVSFGRRMTVKVPIELLGEADFKPEIQNSSNLVDNVM